MLLATPEDVRDALRRELTEAEQQWIEPLILEAGDVVSAYLHPWQIPNPPPWEIVRVVAGLVASVLNRPANVPADAKSLTADVYSISFANGSTGLGPYLSEAFKARLEPFKKLSNGGMVAMELSSERRSVTNQVIDMDEL